MKKFAVILAVIGVVLILYRFDYFFTVENNLTDRSISESRDVDNRIKILAIDSESLSQVGSWPWPRDIMAEIVDDIASHGAEAVWIDVLFTEPSHEEHEDEAWEQLVAEHNNVYLSLYAQFPPRQETAADFIVDRIERPVIPIAEDQLAHINVLEDRDRVVRQILLGIRDEQDDMIPAISVKLANHLLNENEQITWDAEGNWQKGNEPIQTGSRNQMGFSYATAPGESESRFGFEVIPIHMVKNGDIDPSYFRNSIVLIGPYTIALQDDHFTPMSERLKMHGVEIHANVIQSLLDDNNYHEASRAFGMMLIIMMSLVSFGLYELVRAKWATIIMVASVLGYVIAFPFIFNWQNILIPYFYPILAIIMIYMTSLVFQYVREQMEKKRVTNIFGRYVSKDVVSEILSDPDEIKVGGERKDITLIFVDIRGFTPLSEKMEPEEVIQILNEYLELCTRCIFEFEGTIDKFMGDGVMAMFGAPVPQDDHAERAIRTALRMKEASGELSDRLEKEYGRTVHFGIGINSGPAVVGNIGSHDRLDYTSIGDTVNLAARLESNAKPGQILISPETYERIKDKFECTPLDPIKVKGKEKPVQIYQVEAEGGASQ